MPATGPVARKLTRSLTRANTLGQGVGSYIGAVATRGNIPWGYNAGLTDVMTESFHIARDVLTQIKVVFGNWYIDTNNNTNTWQELGTGTTMTIKAGYKSPGGAFSQFLFSGSASGSIASGANIESDWLPVSLSPGDKFSIRPLQHNAGGVMYWPQKADATFGDRWEATAVDKTISGTVSNGFAGYSYAPIAIIGRTTKRSYILFGTSRTFGFDATADGTTGDIGELAPAVGAQYAYCNAGVPGDTAQRDAAAFTKRAAIANSYFSDAVVSHAINDFTGGRTLVQLQGDLATLWATMPTRRIHGPTSLPRTTGAWTLANGSDQTVGTDQAAFNAWMRGRPSPISDVYDINALVALAGNENKWNADGTAAKYTDDGLHGTAFAYSAIKAGLVL